MAANPQTAVAVVDQPADSGMIEWNLDAFPVESYNRLVPVATLQLPTDLLRPVVQVVQLSPDPQAGDVYHSNDMPDGHAAPTRVGLRKLATAAGISFVDERRVDDGRDPNVIEVTTLAEMLLPTGQRIRATGTKRIDLNAQKWSSDAQRQKFKSFFQEHVASRAQNRAIRALLSLRGSYPAAVYQRPFAVVSFAPNMNHPEVRSRMLDAMSGSAAQLYGPAAARQLTPGEPIDVTPAAEEDPAPTTPPTLPGEKLAAAAEVAGDEPAWMREAPTIAADPARTAAPDLTARIRDNAAAGGMVGGAKDPQVETLRTLFAALGGALTTLGLKTIWPELDVDKLTANQAQAIIGVARSFETEADFQAAWRTMTGQAG
jgi:hypothetical protein